MGRNEIRLRRSKISSRRVDRYRNYGELMSRHEQTQKIKRLTRVVIYFLLILFLGIVLFLVFQWEKNQPAEKEKSNQEVIITNTENNFFTHL